MKKKGFTLVEALVASAIIVIVIAGSVAFYLMAYSAWIDCSKRMPLQRKASLAMKKMVRGVDGRNGIREAESVNSPNSSTVCFRSGIDSQVRSFYLDSDEIFYDPTPPVTICSGSTSSIANDEFVIAENVSGLIFTVTGDIVTINLGMQNRVKDKSINVNLRTEVKCRNQ